MTNMYMIIVLSLIAIAAIATAVKVVCFNKKEGQKTSVLGAIAPIRAGLYEIIKAVMTMKKFQTEGESREFTIEKMKDFIRTNDVLNVQEKKLIIDNMSFILDVLMGFVEHKPHLQTKEIDKAHEIITKDLPKVEKELIKTKLAGDKIEESKEVVKSAIIAEPEEVKVIE